MANETGLALPLAAAKLHLRVTSTAEDDLIVDAIRAAQEWIEDYTVLVLTPRTITESADGFDRALELRAWPVASITSIKYLDAIGAEQSLAGTSWQLSNAVRPARVVPTPGSSWPRYWGCSRILARAPVTITFIAGFAAPADIPRVAMQALKLLVAHFYMNRTPVLSGVQAASIEVPLTAKDLLRKWRRRIC